MVQIQSVLSGMIGGAIILFIYLVVVSFIKTQSPHEKYFNWEEILVKGQLTIKEIRDMFLCSVTFGQCATGELFGSLDRLKQELAPVVYQSILRAHLEFGDKIALMYNYREHPEYVNRFKFEALVAYRKLKELKKENKLEFVDPFERETAVAQASAMYPA